MDECEVCEGQFGIIPVCTVTFTADDTGDATPVRMCRACVAAVFEAMARQWNDAIAAGNEAVAAICGQLGIAFQVGDADHQDEDDAPPLSNRDLAQIKFFLTRLTSIVEPDDPRIAEVRALAERADEMQTWMAVRRSVERLRTKMAGDAGHQDEDDDHG